MKHLFLFYWLIISLSCAEADFETVSSEQNNTSGNFVGTWRLECLSTLDFPAERDISVDIVWTASGDYIETTTIFNDNSLNCTGDALLVIQESFKYWMSAGVSLPIPEASTNTSSQTNYNLTIDSFEYLVTPTEALANGTGLKSFEELNVLGFCDVIQWSANVTQDLTEKNPCHPSTSNVPLYAVIRVEEYLDGSPLRLARSLNFTAASSRPKQAGLLNFTIQ
ncbi:MAG: hypothetical protein HRU19_10735 [Pseudobacteriovorax sp.]|nr:hypothetical protein [Pseudobacteriovorax sp.]